MSRFIPRYQPYTQREYLVNAIEMIKESAINDFDEEEEKRALEYLKKCDPNNPIVIALKHLLSQLEVEENPPPGYFFQDSPRCSDTIYRICPFGNCY